MLYLLDISETSPLVPFLKEYVYEIYIYIQFLSFKALHPKLSLVRPNNDLDKIHNS